MDIYAEIIRAIEEKADPVEILRRAKAEGHSQDEAVKALERLFDEAEQSGREAYADVVLDILDVARNYCNPALFVW